MILPSLAFLSLSFISSASYAGGENPFHYSASLAKEGGIQGGGGDLHTEARLHEIRDELRDKFIRSAEAKALRFGYGLTYADYLQGNVEKQVFGMDDMLAPGAVVFNALLEREERTDNAEMNTRVFGYPKVCKGFLSTVDERPHVVCNVEKFWALSPLEQRQQVHHELASLGRIERNIGSESDTFVSRQIGAPVTPTAKEEDMIEFTFELAKNSGEEDFPKIDTGTAHDILRLPDMHCVRDRFPRSFDLITCRGNPALPAHAGIPRVTWGIGINLWVMPNLRRPSVRYENLTVRIHRASFDVPRQTVPLSKAGTAVISDLLRGR